MRTRGSTLVDAVVRRRAHPLFVHMRLRTAVSLRLRPGLHRPRVADRKADQVLLVLHYRSSFNLALVYLIFRQKSMQVQQNGRTTPNRGKSSGAIGAGLQRRAAFICLQAYGQPVVTSVVQHHRILFVFIERCAVESFWRKKVEA